MLKRGHCVLDGKGEKSSETSSFNIFVGGVETELQLMLTKMAALEQKWLIRMVLKDLHVGLGSANILDCFHQDARDLYDVCHNLEKVRS